MTDQLFAFVLMPFDSKFDDVYRLGIRAAVEELGMKANRVDEQVFHKEGILERIYNQIGAADFIIADMTGKNPNVFYEVGYAHAKNKLCILLTSNAEDIPFDLKHHRHIVYGSSISGLKSRLTIDLASIKVELNERENPVVVHLDDIDGYLEKTKFRAEAKISIKLDIRNNTNISSPNIDAIYFYTGGGWKFKQDGHDCAATKAEFEGYSLRHMLKVPLSRVPKGGWAQIKLEGEKTMAATWEGRELKDSYKLTGKALVRVMTENDTYDYPLNLDLEVSEFPF
ncbi:hypothetical protein [Methylocystis sp.]|uniref:hypothetical protein n=1 Tax=Methylocystis sp. TaxID=1911079 RepID=UPI003DA575D5